MNTNYNPSQKLIYYFNKSEKTLYVKSSILVFIKPTEYLEKLNTPSLVNHTATTIQYVVKPSGTPINSFTEKILLKDNINYKELISERFSNFINQKIKEGNEFIFFTIIDQMALTPKFDDIEYSISLIGRFRYIK